MEPTDREKDLLQALTGTAKSAISIVPPFAQAISGWDSYNRSRHDRNIKKLLEHLQQKIDDIDSFFRDEWLRSEEGQQFIIKVIDSALDAQMEDKQELFVNALVQGAFKKEIDHLEKLKFVDMLRHLSRSALMILAEMNQMFIGKVRGENRTPDEISAFPQVDAESIAQKLSSKYHPYLTTAAVRELESEGLFSKTGEWHKSPDGSYRSGRGFATELGYTDFSARFAEFIRDPNEGNT